MCLAAGLEDRRAPFGVDDAEVGHHVAAAVRLVEQRLELLHGGARLQRKAHELALGDRVALVEVVGGGVHDREPLGVDPGPDIEPGRVGGVDHAHERVAPGGVVHDLVLLVVGVAVLPEERAAVGGRLARDHRRGAGASVVHEGHAESDCQAEAQEQEGAIHILRGHDSSLERGWGVG